MPIYFDALEIKLDYEKIFYFGNLSELKNTLILDRIISGDKSILIDIDNLLKYKDNFSEYKSMEEIPNNQSILFRSVAKPSLNHQNMSSIFNINKVN